VNIRNEGYAQRGGSSGKTRSARTDLGYFGRGGNVETKDAQLPPRIVDRAK
jgi:hypothetical protein